MASGYERCPACCSEPAQRSPEAAKVICPSAAELAVASAADQGAGSSGWDSAAPSALGNSALASSEAVCCAFSSSGFGSADFWMHSDEVPDSSAL